jgi:integrase
MKNSIHTALAQPETDAGKIDRNRSPTWQKAGKAHRILRPDELKTQLRLARPAVIPALAIAAFAGLSFWELRTLDWKDVRLDERLILAPGSREITTNDRLVPVPQNLDAWLRPAAKAEGLVARNIDLGAEVHRIAVAIGIERPFTVLRWSFIAYRGAVTRDWNTVSIESGIPPLLLRLGWLKMPNPKNAHEWFNVFPASLRA